MKLSVETVDLELKHTFTIARGSEDVVTSVITTIEHEGLRGYGEASPNSYYSQTPETVTEALREVAPIIEGSRPGAYPELLRQLRDRLDGNRAALCAADLALHDVLGKRRGKPIYKMLGVESPRAPLSSFTIGISSIDHMREKVREARKFPILKIKLGTDRDLDIVRAIREETNATLRIDANCGWDVGQTITMSRELAELGVEFIEQPLPAERLEEMEEVYRESALPVFADENSVTVDDIPSLVGRFHGINIKLVKCGGIAEAMKMVEVARTHDLQIMLGCMIESSAGISAAAHVAPLVDAVDLDGAILITNDPFRGVENQYGQLVFPNRPGLGLEPARS